MLNFDKQPYEGLFLEEELTRQESIRSVVAEAMLNKDYSNILTKILEIPETNTRRAWMLQYFYPHGIPPIPEEHRTPEPSIFQRKIEWGYPTVILWSDGRVTTQKRTPEESQISGSIGGSY